MITQVQEACTWCISQLVLEETCKEVIQDMGGVEALVNVLFSSKEVARLPAVKALGVLSVGERNRLAMIEFIANNQ